MAVPVGETVQDPKLKAIRFLGGNLIATTVTWLDFPLLRGMGIQNCAIQSHR
jgi:hypothetical protein